MNVHADGGRDTDHGKQMMRRERRTYITGALLAFVLTVVPFAVVRWHVMVPHTVYYLIGAFALVQMIMHFRFFLHIGLKQRREDLQLILFSAVLLILIVGGTLWIMASLATRMAMPMHP